MAVAYVGAPPKGRPESSAITDYVIENAADRFLHTTTTQKPAIEWDKANDHSPHIARVRHLNDMQS